MEAACRGAKRAARSQLADSNTSGLTIGILPGGDPSAANPYVDIPIATGLGEARNTIIARAAQAVIAIGGGYGTLSEIAFALKQGRPVIGVKTWKLTPPDERLSPLILYLDDPLEAARQALRLAHGGA